jgi:hypothetical protein
MMDACIGGELKAYPLTAIDARMPVGVLMGRVSAFFILTAFNDN